jgi:outer membrane immunogenic protein
MKKTLLGAAALVAAMSVAAPASAADLPARTYTKAPAMVAAIYDWSGFYIGINGGGGSTRDCWNVTNVGGVVVPSTSEGCHNATGGMVGGQLGYRWQSAAWVFGVEAQGDWADFKGSNTSLFFPGVTDQTKMDAFGLFTGQVGYAWNNVLWYVKGGVAVTDNKYRGFTTAGNILLDQENDTRWGGTVGTGVEVSFALNWSVAFEYDHLFMGSHSVNFNTPAGAFSRTDNIKQDVDIGSVRVNYRWGGPVIAKY